MNPVYWLLTALLISLSFQTWILPLLVGIVAFALCALALLHERRLVPPEILGVPGLMNILDRLTNKAQLQALLTPKKPPTHLQQSIDWDQARELMREGIIGHNAMIDDILSRVQLAYQKVKRSRPVAVIMLAGPPSTGKTEVGKVLSKALFGNQEAYRVPGETLKQGATSVLSGAPPGTVGSTQSSSLVQFLRAYPASVVIVDEFEKAASDVRDMFLGAWNDGQFADHSQGGEVSTRDVIFIVTTNAQQAAIAKLVESFEGREDARDELSDRCKDVLKQTFSDALLSRVTGIYPMRELVEMNMAELLLKIVDNEISEFGLKLVECSPHVLANYVAESASRGATARTMRAKIEKEVGEQAGALQKAGHRLVTIVERDGEVIVEPYREPAPKSPPPPKNPAPTKPLAKPRAK